MATIPQFAPPGNLDDFDAIPHQREAWDEFLSQTFQGNVKGVEKYTGAGKSQFYNPRVTDTTEPSAVKEIRWKGFPLLVAQRHPGNKVAAWREADQLTPPGNVGERPQDEYLEWFVTRNAQGKVTRVTFTCEGPEYWEALAHGYPLDYTGPRAAGGTGDKQKVLALYREHISPAVQLADLFDAQGRYDRLNKWNTSQGAMHLNQRNNTLGAEINIAAFATILRRKDGQVLTDADDLIRCARYGAAGRASDPRIGADVNALARDGYSVTLQNPVGLYIDSLETAGWVTPNNKPAAQFWKTVRGKGGLTVRAVYEVPASEGYVVGDIKIGGRPIEYGGQIADFVNIKLSGVACRKGGSSNAAHPCEGVGAIAAAVPAGTRVPW